MHTVEYNLFEWPERFRMHVSRQFLASPPPFRQQGLAVEAFEVQASFSWIGLVKDTLQVPSKNLQALWLLNPPVALWDLPMLPTSQQVPKNHCQLQKDGWLHLCKARCPQTRILNNCPNSSPTLSPNPCRACTLHKQVSTLSSQSEPVNPKP